MIMKNINDSDLWFDSKVIHIGISANTSLHIPEALILEDVLVSSTLFKMGIKEIQNAKKTPL